MSSLTLAEAIDALGTTPEQVSAKLREMGIKGYHWTACNCPIAKYLNACGFPYVSVANHATLYGSDLPNAPSTERIRLEPGVVEWIHDFDRGDYPEFSLRP